MALTQSKARSYLMKGYSAETAQKRLRKLEKSAESVGGRYGSGKAVSLLSRTYSDLRAEAAASLQSLTQSADVLNVDQVNEIPSLVQDTGKRLLNAKQKQKRDALTAQIDARRTEIVQRTLAPGRMSRIFAGQG